MKQEITGLKKAIPYLREYKGKTFVIKIGGEVISDASSMDSFAQQVSLLHQLGISVVIVHGGGSQATELCEQLGIEVKTVNGRRITDAATLEVAKMIYNGKLNTDLLAALQKQMVPAAGLSGVDAGCISAARRPVKKIRDMDSGSTVEVDFGFVGDIISVNVGLIDHLINGSFVPVISSMAGGENGEVYNVNADTVAANLASALKAQKLILMTSAPGVLENKDDESSLISVMDRKGLDRILEESAVGGMHAKLQACAGALDGGVPRSHIISGERPDSLLIEIFTNEGCGTLIENE